MALRLTEENFKGLGGDAVKELRQQGVLSVRDYLCRTSKEILKSAPSLTPENEVALRIEMVVRVAPPAARGSDLLALLPRTLRIYSTGSERFDALLGGGLMGGEIVELIGEPAAGKTQACLTIAAVCALEHKTEVLYLDTSGGFGVERVSEILSARTGNPDTLSGTLALIHTQHVSSVHDLLGTLESLRERLERGEHAHLGCVVIDSITPLIYPLINGAYTQSRALMAHVALALRTIASSFHIAVVMTNQAVKDVPGHGLKAGLGLTWAHVPATRVLLTREPVTHVHLHAHARSRDEGMLPEPDRYQTVARVVKSQAQPAGLCTSLFITPRGLDDDRGV